MTGVSLKVNGHPHHVDADPQTPLLRPAVANAVVRAGGPLVSRLPFARSGLVSA